MSKRKKMMKTMLRILTAITVDSAFTAAQAQDDLIYVAVEPCRIADTRIASEGFIKANTNRDFRVAGTSEQLAAQGGKVDCLNPKTQKPVAVAAYILAVPNGSSSGRGVLSAYPSDLPPPPVGSGSTVNFAKDQVIGNTTIVTVCDSNPFASICPVGGELAVLARSSDENVVIDVQGYFYPAQEAPHLEIVSIEKRVDLSGTTTAGVDVNCPPGTQLISGGAFATGDTVITDSFPVKAVSDTEERWNARFVSRTGAAVVGSSISSIAVCVSGFNPTIVAPPVIEN
jgi:hypothetical protein